MMEEHELGGKLLAGVSRSFYLTLKALPEGMREPLSLGYLLARASDTLADTQEVPNETRLELLKLYREVVLKSDVQADERQPLLQKIRERFVPLQTDENEKLLLERLDEALEALLQSSEQHQVAIREVLNPILTGQISDVSYFKGSDHWRAFESRDQLNEYTYLVAGCVGEFWTKLGHLEFGSEFSHQDDMKVLLQQGKNFGKALQLINILRDVGKDAKLGRCYLPEEQIVQEGLSLEEVRENPGRLRVLTLDWIECAEAYLRGALEYVESLKQPRVRLASALPMMLGFKTLKMLRTCSDSSWLEGVKVTRTDVAKVLMDAGFANLKIEGYRKWVEKNMV